MHDQRNFIPILALLATLATPAPDGGQPPPNLSFWTVGSEGLAFRFGTDLYPTLEGDREVIESILLAVAEQPLADRQIAESTHLSRSRLRDLMGRLEAVHLVRKAGDRWAATLPVVTDERMKQIRQALMPLARAVARAIGGEVPGLARFYDSVRSPADPPWRDIAHLVVDKFIVDGTFHSALERLERERGVLDRYYSPEQRRIPAFFLERGEHFSTLGSNWYPFWQGDAQREVYVLHGALFERFDIRMNAYRKDPVFSTALFGITQAGGIASLGDAERGVLHALGWIDGDRLLVPVVQAAAMKAVLSRLEAIGSAGAMTAFNRHSIITGAFDLSPYSAFLDGAGDYIQVCYHVLFGLVLEQLVETGVLPGLPEPVPEHVGVYIIMGKLF
jgi:hypothetical protein